MKRSSFFKSLAALVLAPKLIGELGLDKVQPIEITRDAVGGGSVGFPNGNTIEYGGVVDNSDYIYYEVGNEYSIINPAESNRLFYTFTEGERIRLIRRQS